MAHSINGTSGVAPAKLEGNALADIDLVVGAIDTVNAGGLSALDKWSEIQRQTGLLMWRLGLYQKGIYTGYQTATELVVKIRADLLPGWSDPQ